MNGGHITWTHNRVLLNAVPFCDDVSRGPRADWLGRALERTEGRRPTEESCIVLLDPDKCLASPSQQGRNSPKHAYLHEVKPFVKCRQTVVMYQSYWRRKKGDTRDHEMRRWRDDRGFASCNQSLSNNRRNRARLEL